MKKTRGRRPTPLQQKFRSTKFSFDQYWCFHFTEKYKDDTEKDFKAIIKARSSDFAKKILILKTREDQPTTKLKSISFYMLHKEAEINTKHLNIVDWKHIHNCAFPNEVNILFKYHKPRPLGHTNRFNKQASPKNRFSATRRPPPVKKFSKEEKSKMIYDGKWKPWPKKERQALLEKIIVGLKLNNNIRSKTAKYLNLSIKEFRKLLTDKFIEVNWEKDYPIPEKIGQPITQEQRVAMNLARQKKSEHRMKTLEPTIINHLNEGKSKLFICKELSLSKKFLNKCIKYYEQP